MPFLDTHRRRIPAQTVAHSHALGMGAQSAPARDRARLAFVTLSVDGLTLGRALRSHSRIDPATLSLAGIDLAAKDDLEAVPALTKNPPGQSELLPNHPHGRDLAGKARARGRLRVASCAGAPDTMIAEYAKPQADTPGGRFCLPPRPEGRGILRGT